MSDMIINIATDFYPRPAGRFSADGEYTGIKFLLLNLKNFKVLQTVILLLILLA